ncbi:hypothetical protein AAJP47_04560 [Psychrobacter sp. B38]|uniref:hypothetical protein n=1 Tax=Psychrobacter sp. B38 TaxID=3143538 RepID=UPI00320D21E0
MANLQLTHAPILNSSAQLLILPVNTTGILLDPVLTRTKTLFPDNYQHYHRTCRDGSLNVGSCLLHKRALEQTGLGVSSSGNQPSHIANLVISDHPYHPARMRWLSAALMDLQQQLMPLIRYQGIRKAALLARPLIFDNPRDHQTDPSDLTYSLPLDWHTDTLPLLTQHLQSLPKLRIDIHLPKDVNI